MMPCTLSPNLEYMLAQNFEFAIINDERLHALLILFSSRCSISGFKRLYADFRPNENWVEISLRAVEGGPCRYQKIDGIKIICEKLIVAKKLFLICLEFRPRRASYIHVSNQSNEVLDALEKCFIFKFKVLIPILLILSSAFGKIMGDVIVTSYPMLTSSSAR